MSKHQTSLLKYGVKKGTKSDTRVVKLQRKNGKVVQDCDVYIGRAVVYGGWKLTRSIWANPFKLGQGGLNTVKDVLNAYETHVRNNPSLLSKICTLRGKVLGCWCSPQPCHGNVLVKLVNELNE
jgi:hypothetical protein